MKRSINFYWLVLTIFINIHLIPVSNAIASPIKEHLFAVFNISLEDSEMIGHDSVQFCFSKNGINSDWNTDTYTYSFKLNKRNNRLEIPLSSKLVYGRINYFGSKLQSFSPLSNDNNLFLFEAGDTVKLILSNRKLGCLFVGKSSPKYKCMYEISNQVEISNKTFNYLLKKRQFDDAYKSIITGRDSLFNCKVQLLQCYKEKINKNIFNLIKIDSWATCNRLAIGQIMSPYIVYDSTQYQVAKRTFEFFYSSFPDISKIPLTDLVTSYKYCDYLIDRILDDIIVSKSIGNQNYSRSIKFKDINEAIDMHYSPGILRDKLKLLAYDSMDGDRQSDYIDFIDQSINQAVSPRFKTALSKFKSIHKVGAKAYAFSLKDENNHTYDLKNFQGKILIIDFWFTGCFACAKLATALKPIISSFKTNREVIFVSVSIDRNKEAWLASIKQGKYCDSDEINLLEGENGNSSFLKYYNIIEYPTLLIIGKNSEIISTNPPNPRTQKEKFITLIKNNL